MSDSPIDTQAGAGLAWASRRTLLASSVTQGTPPVPYRSALQGGRAIYGERLRSIGMKQEGA
jgi:hypothetical protein